MRLLTLFFSLIAPICAAQLHVTSPDGAVKVTVSGGAQLRISAGFKATQILKPSDIAMLIHGSTQNWSIRKTSLQKIDETIVPPVPEKRKSIANHYNALIIKFRSNISLDVRAYNDGFAYRFTSSFKDSITVDAEVARYSFPSETIFYGSAVTKRQDADIFHTSFEEPYRSNRWRVSQPISFSFRR